MPMKMLSKSRRFSVSNVSIDSRRRHIRIGGGEEAHERSGDGRGRSSVEAVFSIFLLESLCSELRWRLL